MKMEWQGQAVESKLRSERQIDGSSIARYMVERAKADGFS